MTRLRILSDDDFDKLYKIPKFNDEERQVVFELDEEDKNYLNTINSIPIKINYILHLGYFQRTWSHKEISKCSWELFRRGFQSPFGLVLWSLWEI